jgi:hypothetical protein
LEVFGVVAHHYAKVLAFDCCHFALIFGDQRLNRWELLLMINPAADVARRQG